MAFLLLKWAVVVSQHAQHPRHFSGMMLLLMLLITPLAYLLWQVCCIGLWSLGCPRQSLTVFGCQSKTSPWISSHVHWQFWLKALRPKTACSQNLPIIRRAANSLTGTETSSTNRLVRMWHEMKQNTAFNKVKRGEYISNDTSAVCKTCFFMFLHLH